MTAYQVNYDLKEPGQDYDALFDAVKSYDDYWHELESTWIITTDDSASEVRDNLKQYIDSNDKLMIVKVTKGWATISVDNTDWLRDNL